MFRFKHKYNSIADVRKFLKDMTQEVLDFFDEVQTLLRTSLFLLCRKKFQFFETSENLAKQYYDPKTIKFCGFLSHSSRNLGHNWNLKNCTTCAKIWLMIGFTFFIFLFLMITLDFIKLFSGGFFLNVTILLKLLFTF